MKALQILDCILYQGLSGEDLNIIDVPEENDEFTPQDEEWWMMTLGGYPPSPVEAGKYLCLYPNDARDWLQTSNENYLPDTEVEVGDSIVYLYKIED